MTDFTAGWASILLEFGRPSAARAGLMRAGYLPPGENGMPMIAADRLSPIAMFTERASFCRNVVDFAGGWPTIVI